jgi:ADP-ribose pyrophosphatase YjhB (NUDIX family)
MSVKEVPRGGLCLSSFLVLAEKGRINRILMGRLNPAAPWDHIGALDAPRMAVHSKGWMLPSSHLILYESPHDAARRILHEQLNLDEIELSEPKVVSEVYIPKRFPNLQSHWDIEFIFRGEIGEDQLKPRSVWVALEFLDLGKLNSSDISRSHDDILASVGLSPGLR